MRTESIEEALKWAELYGFAYGLELAAEVRRLEAENEKAKHIIADLLGCKPMEASQ